MIEVEAILALAMFATAMLALLAGYPVALTLGGVGLIFGIIGVELGLIPLPILRNLPSRILGSMENQVLISVPLFVLMGVILERSRVADDLLDTAGRLLQNVKGGMGYAVVIVGALLAASTGIVGATVVTMTLIALPAMLRQGYDPKLATGTIAASGTLGQIIPPSIVLILLADAVSTANQAAAARSGQGAGVVSVGDLFAGAIVPGLMLVGLYLLYLLCVSIIKPDYTPDLAPDADQPALRLRDVLITLGAPLLLILAVLGSILGGLASPTEAAGVGAGGALLLAGLRLAPGQSSKWPVRFILAALAALPLLGLLARNFDLSLIATSGLLQLVLTAFAIGLCFTLIFGLAMAALVLKRARQLHDTLNSGTQITSMVFLILIGASLFALVFRALGGDHYVEALLTGLPGGMWGALVATMLVMFVLGFFLDFIEIVFVVVPIVAPPLIVLGADPVWLAILMALNLQTSFLTPPFGFALFYLRGAAPDGVETLDIWRGAIPFIGLQLLMILLVASIPALATHLPDQLR